MKRNKILIIYFYVFTNWAEINNIEKYFQINNNNKKIIYSSVFCIGAF